MGLKLQNVAGRIVVLKFQEELAKRRQEVAARPPTRVLGREMPVGKLPSWTQGGGGVSLPNPLDLLNRIAPRRPVYDFQPMVQPFMGGTRPIQPQPGLPGQQIANIGSAQLQKYLASPGPQMAKTALQGAMTPMLPESVTSLPVIGRPLATLSTPIMYTGGVGPLAEMVAGQTALGALGRLGWGERGEEILGTAGLVGGPLARPAYRGAQALAESVLPEVRAATGRYVERSVPIGAARGYYGEPLIEEVSGLKLPFGKKAAEMITPVARQERLAWRKQLSEGIEITTGSQKRAMGAAAKVAAQSEGDDVTKSALGKLAYWVRTYKPRIPEYGLAKHEELARRSAEIERIWQSELSPGEKLLEARRITTGELVPGAGKANVPLTDAEVTSLEEMIGTADLTPFERPTTLEILRDLTSTGRKLTDGEIALLGKAYGIPFASEVFGAQRGTVARLSDEIYELYRIPMQLMSSGELSATLRQGALNVGRPRQMGQAFKVELQVIGMPKVAEERYLFWENHPLIKTYGGKLDLTPIGKAAETASYGAREEQYLGHVGPQAKTTVARIFNAIPGVGQVARMSERTYIGFLNEVTAARFVDHIERWQKMGVEITPELSDALSQWLNICRGRGPLGPLAKHVKLLTVPLWAPRLWAARLATVPKALQLGIANPEMRGIIARDLASFIAINTGLLVALKQSGLADVEIDPRSTDVLKIRVGPIRIDPWGGFQQTARALAQIATGQGKATETGAFYKRARLETALRTVGGKLNPAFGLGVDIARGETMLGEEVTPSGATAKSQAWNRLVPLFWQDLADAYRAEGLKGVAIASPGVLGVGVQVYETPFGKEHVLQDTIAKEHGFKDFDDMVGGPKGLGAPAANKITDADQRIIDLQPEIEKYKATRGSPTMPTNVAYDSLQKASDTYRQSLVTLEPQFLTNAPQAAAALKAAKETRINQQFLVEQMSPDLAKRNAEFKAPTTPIGQWTADEVFNQEMSFYRNLGANPTADQKDAVYQKIDAFEAQLSSDQYSQLQVNIGAKDDPVMALRRSGLAQIDSHRFNFNLSPGVKVSNVGYYDIDEAIWLTVRDRNLKDDSRVNQLTYQGYKDWLVGQHPELAVGDVLQRSSVVKFVDSNATKARQAAESKYPEIVGIQVAWGLRSNIRDEQLKTVMPYVQRIRGEIRQTLAMPMPRPTSR